jgi:folate-binding protein YgfZ
VFSSAALVELPWRGVVELTGRDRARFLHGMCTQEIRKLAPGEGRAAAVVGRQGKMLAELTVHVLPDRLLLQVDRANLQPAVDALSKFVVADDVAFAASDRAVLGVHGPAARGALGVAEMADFAGGERDGAWIARNRTVAADGYDLLVPAARLEETRKRLAGLPTASEADYEAARIAAGWPRWGKDMGPELLPMEAGLEPIAIRYDKGCYIGQEVIQRVKTYSEPPRMLVQLVLEGDAPPAGTPVTSRGEEVGRVTSSSGRFALALVRKEVKAPGSHVEVGPRRAHVAARPWQERLARPS